MLYCIIIGFVLAISCNCQTTLEQRIAKLEKKLEHGGKEYENVPNINSKLLYAYI